MRVFHFSDRNLMRSVLFILLLALAALQYKLWMGDGNILQKQLLQKKLASYLAKNEKAASQNRALAADILELKRGEQALEEQARELGMIKQDEVFYQFID
jgi:cell division protein FtsB